MLRRLGLAVPLSGFELDEVPALAALAEEAGYTDFWTSEVSAADGFTPLAAAAVGTETIRLGVSIVPVFTRPAPLLGMTAASLQSLSSGRFWLGLGASSPTIVERWMGLRYSQPVLRTREVIESLRLISTGERVDYTGKLVAIQGFTLDMPPTEIPILLGAMGPKMLALAGEMADGVATTFIHPEGVPRLLDETFWPAVEQSGRRRGDLEVTCRIWVSIDDDRPTVLRMLRSFIAPYAAVPDYNRLLSLQGFAEEAAAIAEAWRRRDREALHTAVTDELIVSLNPVGDLDTCIAHLDELRRNGVTTPIIAPVSSEADPSRRRVALRSVIEAVAHADSKRA
jgi:probable F420-dependent oxidoreductase